MIEFYEKVLIKFAAKKKFRYKKQVWKEVFGKTFGKDKA